MIVAYLLHIESSSTLCSVALSNGDSLVALKELDAGYTHAENLHVFIKELLQEQNMDLAQLQAISVSSGPGSYTGLRIGFATAKGLAYTLRIPLIVVETLKVLASLAVKQYPGASLFCPMLDARRMEVYTALYSKDLALQMAPMALVLDKESIARFREPGTAICFFGDGMPKAKALLESIPSAHFLEGIRPGSEAMIPLAYGKFRAQDFADTAYAEPFYLKDFFFTTAKK